MSRSQDSYLKTINTAIKILRQNYKQLSFSGMWIL